MCHNLLYPFQYFLKSQTFIWVGFVVHRDRERGEEREDRVVGREFRCRRTFSSVPPSAGGARPIERSKKGESVEALKTPKLKHFHWPDEQLDWLQSLHSHQQQLQQADRSHKRCFSRLLRTRIWIWRTFCHSRWKGTLYHDKCCKRIFFVFTSDNLQLVVSENFTLPEDMIFGEAHAIAITTYRWKFFLTCNNHHCHWFCSASCFCWASPPTRSLSTSCSGKLQYNNCKKALTLTVNISILDVTLKTSNKTTKNAPKRWIEKVICPGRCWATEANPGWRCSSSTSLSPTSSSSSSRFSQEPILKFPLIFCQTIFVQFRRYYSCVCRKQVLLSLHNNSWRMCFTDFIVQHF